MHGTRRINALNLLCPWQALTCADNVMRWISHCKFVTLGRWQPFHDGHLELFKRALAKTGQVAIQVRDCQDWDNSNPFSYEQIKNSIMSKLSDNGYIMVKDYIIQLVPNITNITYGRKVGYDIEQEYFDESITQISGTKIRKRLGLS